MHLIDNAFIVNAHIPATCSFGGIIIMLLVKLGFVFTHATSLTLTTLLMPSLIDSFQFYLTIS